MHVVETYWYWPNMVQYHYYSETDVVADYYTCCGVVSLRIDASDEGTEDDFLRDHSPINHHWN
jgi:hypothetical protein